MAQKVATAVIDSAVIDGGDCEEPPGHSHIIHGGPRHRVILAQISFRRLPPNVSRIDPQNSSTVRCLELMAEAAFRRFFGNGENAAWDVESGTRIRFGEGAPFDALGCSRYIGPDQESSDEHQCRAHVVACHSISPTLANPMGRRLNTL